MLTMLSPTEGRALIRAVEGATTLAAAGHLADGYDLLLAGFRRAEARRDAGQSGAEELARHYGLAMDNYTDAYGVALR